MFQKVDLPMEPAASARGAKVWDEEICIEDGIHQLIIHPAKKIIASGHASRASNVKGTAAPTFTPSDLAHECAVGALFV